MSEIVFAVPGDLSLPTGGYGYDRRLLAEWREIGVGARHLPLPGSFPNPGEADLAETGRAVLSQPYDSVLLIDGLAYGGFPESIAAGLAGRVVALVHHPLGLETGLSPVQAAEFVRRETAALRYASAVIVTSETTKRLLVADFAVPAEKITVAEPGVDPAARATGSAGESVELLAVGSLVPRKGYDVLIAALEGVADRPWRLTIVGADDRAPTTTASLKAQIAAAGLAERVRLAGAFGQAELDAAYAKADLFVMPSLFEGYGMVLTEALARGLPILCTTGGAAAQTAPDEAALKVPPGDVAALRAGLARLLDDKRERLQRSTAAWQAAGTLPRWRGTATIVAEVCAKVSP
ncbi:Glycosyl transferases group 1 [Bosea sp. 62]|uniref:glycosyltransferase family 4 protein n=1 Tax=unclassified Bosea (in: a-proteobacteria) TaxID=2653178 RepID=UPI00125A97E8|nr:MULTISPECIES: glycosyltransferase family 4 protein [unclassified Bosea (in: a-proteobacteria)]CAD5247602.1 Glycosyl transferases group 1 [Bosea sp. 46]CAD5249181.1 Glycosyl transferases group 1 [Bosea sp. 21B]CAD5266983.1 Glycosyl transferases group 1 [Bosea sp. 7B]VVT45133.1 Glycosyl transferases group 1 [Bosea sp. EC-HK365B]VXA99085.1 Glycosyl transferases group 1 [Bosea sp. 29B]